jgi:hypothetical protein
MRRSRPATIAASLLSAVACSSAERQHLQTSEGWRRSSALIAPCARCHADIVEEWRGSLHHASFEDADFQRSFREEPLAFCVSCHAPLASSQQDSAHLAEGIGCSSCHGHSAEHAADPARERPTTQTCDRCHEFSFPGRADRMQRTVEEHGRSPSSGAPCASCHMPSAATHRRSHRFAASRDETVLRAALAVDPLRRTPNGIDVVMRSLGVGHAFPTGDLFRSLRVRLWSEDASGRVLSDDEASLTRVFRDDRGAAVSTEAVEVHDERIVPGEAKALHFAIVDVAHVARAHVRVTYDRVAAIHEGVPILFGSTVLVDATREFLP